MECPCGVPGTSRESNHEVTQGKLFRSRLPFILNTRMLLIWVRQVTFFRNSSSEKRPKAPNVNDESGQNQAIQVCSSGRI